MRNKNEPAPSFDAPIPGQSLTAPVGDRPWQRPPQFPTADQALAFYVDRVTNERQASEMMDLLEMGVPVDTLVDTLQLGGVMQGLHSVDVGMIIAPALTEVISKMAEKSGVEHTVMSTDTDEKAPTKTEIALTLNEMKARRELPKEEPVEEPQEEEAMEDEEPRGLMARRS